VRPLCPTLAPMKLHQWLPLIALLVTPSVHADWAILGAATRCDPVTNTFEIAPVIEVSSPDLGEVSLKEGFRRLPEGINKLRCKLAGGTVSATIRVFRPDNGMCMGSGYVDITRLLVGDIAVPVPSPGEPFNWVCTDPLLMKVKIRHSTKKKTLEKCKAADWRWGEGFSQVTCNTQVLTHHSSGTPNGAP